MPPIGPRGNLKDESDIEVILPAYTKVSYHKRKPLSAASLRKLFMNEMTHTRDDRLLLIVISHIHSWTSERILEKGEVLVSQRL